MLTITPVYAAILAILFMRLTVRVIKTRRQEKVAIGDGGNIKLQRAIAAHANFAQYAPFGLLLIAFIELQSTPIYIVHIIALTLLIGRLIHAYGVSQAQENFKLRTIGMVLTITSTYGAAITLFGLFVYRMFI